MHICIHWKIKRNKYTTLWLHIWVEKKDTWHIKHYIPLSHNHNAYYMFYLSYNVQHVWMPMKYFYAWYGESWCYAWCLVMTFVWVGDLSHEFGKMLHPSKTQPQCYHK